MDLPELQQTIRDLPGVASAVMRWPDPREPVCVRLTFAPGADREQVTTAVLSLIRESGAADPTTVEVAGRRRRSGPGARPVFLGLRVYSGLRETAVEVVLDVGGERITGRAEGLPVTTSEIRSAAAATLSALRAALPDLVRLEVDWLDVGQALPGEPLSVLHAGVTCVAPGSPPQRLYGSAQVQNDARVAAARATLDAMNRRLPQLSRAS